MEKSLLSVYFDGACVLCSKEISYYQKQENSSRIRFVDISGFDFDAVKEGLDPDKVEKVFHVKTKEGNIVEGVPAFAEIWDTLEIWKPMSLLSKSFLGGKIMDLGYVFFSKVRPYLPRKENCEVCRR